jgi:DNA-binding response OmpR family regulator
MAEKNRIMLIDDEKDFLSFLKLNLEMTGRFDVATLSSAKDVIKEVLGFKPDIIVMDINMPNVGGIEACRILKTNIDTKCIPIIILSASTTEDDIDNMRRAGALDNLMKPVKTEQLVTKIDNVLNNVLRIR